MVSGECGCIMEWEWEECVVWDDIQVLCHGEEVGVGVWGHGFGGVVGLAQGKGTGW